MKTPVIITYDGRPVGSLQCHCPSCGMKKPPRMVPCASPGNRVALKCTECGLNTGPRKSPRLALNAWNAMAPRLIPSQRLTNPED